MFWIPVNTVFNINGVSIVWSEYCRGIGFIWGKILEEININFIPFNHIKIAHVLQITQMNTVFQLLILLKFSYCEELADYLRECPFQCKSIVKPPFFYF